jgi:hypothetical protein
MSYTLLSNGLIWGLDDPDPSVISPEVLAHALSAIPRFCGHTEGNVPYSVAQHSCVVASALPPEIAIHGLLHDAHEAFMGDIPTPIKHRLKGVDVLEDRFDRAIYAGLDVAWPSDETRARVKEADLAALNLEVARLMPKPKYIRWEKAETPVVIPGVLRPKWRELAKAEFLEMFWEYSRAARA